MIYFVTGTDTDSGKTLVSSALLHLATGMKCGVKPIASGCERTDLGLRNADALSLLAQSNMNLNYQLVNPISFEPAIAPHIAAAQQGVQLSAKQVLDCLPITELLKADFGLIEGAGGWRLPLGNGEYLSDTVKLLNQSLMSQQQPIDLIPVDVRPIGVILVVGMKLGCLNHAQLTQEAVLADGLKIVGWVANQVDKNMAFQQENLASLQSMMQAPYLGYVPFLDNPDAEKASQHLDISKLAN